MIRAAIANELQPIVVLLDAPEWGEGAGRSARYLRQPDPGELAQFATAAARRYSGAFEGLPRVRYWQIWNEPNLLLFLSPQVAGGRLVSPEIYRAMVNAVTPAIHAVHRDNVAIAGGTAPFGRHGWSSQTPPLEFARELLCMRGRVHPTAKCSARTRFDVWGTHPTPPAIPPTMHRDVTTSRSLTCRRCSASWVRRGPLTTSSQRGDHHCG